MRRQTERATAGHVRTGGAWFGDGDAQPVSSVLGRQDDGRGSWGGWVYAVDADTGVWKWRLKVQATRSSAR